MLSIDTCKKSHIIPSFYFAESTQGVWKEKKAT